MGDGGGSLYTLLCMYVNIWGCPWYMEVAPERFSVRLVLALAGGFDFRDNATLYEQ